MFIKLYTGLINIHPEGNVSQIFDLGPGFFYGKKRVTFDHSS